MRCFGEWHALLLLMITMFKFTRVANFLNGALVWLVVINNGISFTRLCKSHIKHSSQTWSSLWKRQPNDVVGNRLNCSQFLIGTYSIMCCFDFDIKLSDRNLHQTFEFLNIICSLDASLVLHANWNERCWELFETTREDQMQEKWTNLLNGLELTIPLTRSNGQNGLMPSIAKVAIDSWWYTSMSHALNVPLQNRFPFLRIKNFT